MVERKIKLLTKGGIYLAKLNPAKSAEVGKVRPVAILTSQAILDVDPNIVFICPLSSKSHAEYSSLHVELSPRDSLKVTSFALVEHCRAIGSHRLIYPRIAQLTSVEIDMILHKLNVILE